jgi:hypothetical protein
MNTSVHPLIWVCSLKSIYQCSISTRSSKTRSYSLNCIQRKHPMHINNSVVNLHCSFGEPWWMCLSVVNSWITDVMGYGDNSRRLKIFQGMSVHFEIISYLIKIHTSWFFAYIYGLFFYLLLFCSCCFPFEIQNTFTIKPHPTGRGSTPHSKCNLRWTQQEF